MNPLDNYGKRAEEDRMSPEEQLEERLNAIEGKLIDIDNHVGAIQDRIQQVLTRLENMQTDVSELIGRAY
jgi:predicted  nucleic acid-binding Zn-ribbon protein